MAQMLLGVALTILLIGVLAYAITLSGREVVYIAPLSVEAEVGMGLLVLGGAAATATGSAIAVAVGGLAGALLGTGAAVILGVCSSRPLLRRWQSDQERVRTRRAARAKRRSR